MWSWCSQLPASLHQVTLQSHLCPHVCLQVLRDSIGASSLTANLREGLMEQIYRKPWRERAGGNLFPEVMGRMGTWQLTAQQVTTSLLSNCASLWTVPEWTWMCFQGSSSSLRRQWETSFSHSVHRKMRRKIYLILLQNIYKHSQYSILFSMK